jgi:ABC-type antimicrobial peptide transport system permease subunit
MIGDSTKVIYLLLIGAVALIIISVTNMINLFVSHTAEQQHLFAINAALGAKKRDLVLGLFIEIGLLMLFANVLSLLFAYSGFYLLSHYLNEFLPLVSQLTLQIVTVIPFILLSVVITFIIAKLGTSVINYQYLSSTLQSGSKGINAQVSSTIRKGLIICQIAMASSLVFCSVNISLNAAEKLTNPLGYQRSDLSYLSISISPLKKEEENSFEQQFSLIQQIKARLLARPEVKGISSAESPIGSFMNLSINDIDTNTGYVVETSFADENYFKLIGQPLMLGDNFVKSIKQYRNQELIINEAFANKLVKKNKLANKNNVIGKKLDFSNDGSNVYTVIGVVRGILAPGEENIPLRMYAPASTSATKFLIKFEKNQQLSREKIIKNLKEVSGVLTISQYKSLSDSFNQTLQIERITVVTTIAVTVISLFLAALGLYGILSYSTQMRRFEIGTRLAIGAKRVDMIRLIVQDNAAGVIIGVCLSVLVLVSLRVVFNAQLNSYLNWQLLPVFLLTLGLICSISFIACYLPLRKYINKPALYSLRGAE